MSLLDTLREIIASEGPLSLERYMALCLGHPRHGYYMTRDPFGVAGDFTTAPEISQIFGELLGLWAAEVWRMMGAPSPVRLVELGPGRGTLMADALRAARVLPPFAAALDVHLVETSPVLRERQRATLAASGILAVPTWHERLEEVPEGPAIIFANEFFDALPVRHYVRTDAGWCERLVGLDSGGALAWGLGRQPDAGIGVAGPPGEVLEVATVGLSLAQTLARRLAEQGGTALVIDYGHTEGAFGETLQAMKAHAFADPLTEPGEADLTTHVDFAALAGAALGAGAAVHGPVEQGAFLRALGAEARAAQLAAKARERGNEEAARTIETGVARLVGRGEGQMGALFKVLAVADPRLGPLPGLDPRRLPSDIAPDAA